ncbi:MAG: transposase [Streptosporangiaceae bacterium]
MRVLHERVAGIDVHKDMVKIAIRSPGDKPWTRKTEILEYRTFYGVLQHMAAELRKRGVTHVVMEASTSEIQRPGRALESAGIKLGSVASAAARWQRQADLLKTIPGFGDVVARAWLGEIGPAPHQWFSGHEKLACWVTLCPGSNISARKRKHGRTGDAGTCIKPMLVQAAWAAIRVRGRLQARYSRLVRRFGGDKNPGAKKKAITAIARTLLKIACQVLRAGTPCQEPGADFCTRRESPRQRQKFLERAPGTGARPAVCPGLACRRPALITIISGKAPLVVTYPVSLSAIVAIATGKVQRLYWKRPILLS